MQTTVSVFQDFVKKVENTSLDHVLNDIKIGTYKDEISNIRKLLNEGKKEEAGKFKKLLKAFTVSGTFDSGSSNDKIEMYTQYIILDIDNLNVSHLHSLKNIARIAPYTYSSFISPSGKGLKIIVKVNTGKEHHKEAYKQVAYYYEQVLSIEVDTSGSDVSRLCFVSFDEDCFINYNAVVFNVELSIVKNQSIKIEKSHQNDFELFQNSINFTNNVTSYYEGNRNNYIYNLACNCNRLGLYEVSVIELAIQSFDLTPEEIKKAVKSAYKNNMQDFAKFANIANSNNSKNDYEESEKVTLINMPYLPNHVFDKLPNILKKGCEVFKDLRERDVFFTGAISILSGCMNPVSGNYRGKRNFANLYSFVIAPAASGKGSLTYARDLGNKYHERLVAESSEKLKQYKIKEIEYKKNLANKAIDVSSLEPPIEPPFKVLYIPANCSSARVVQHLKENDEMGIFCETEADSMGNVLKQDWGGYSDLLRKAFQHEPISLSRKTDKEYSEIKSPRLSVALAGTPGQVENLIKTAEDGLFSRFIFYKFKTELKWIDADENMNGVNLTSHFDSLSNEVLIFVDYLIKLNEVNFTLQKHQWKILNKYGSDQLAKLGNLISEDLAGTSIRLVVILFRFCLILTALRYFDNGEYTKEFICFDEDFEIAHDLVNVYAEHSIQMFYELPKSGNVTEKVIQKLFDVLPFQFQRKKAVEIAESKFQIKPRTTDLYLTKLTNANYIEKIKNGFYQKTK